jgi:short-subunit dehydrogenase
MNLELTGKRAFISGSTQGIGFAIAQQLLNEGVSVIINGREVEKARKAKDKLQEEFPKGTITAIAADFSKEEEVAKLLTQLQDIDILINNVGIFEIKDFQNIKDEDWYTYF